MADLREDSVEVKPSIIMKVDAPPEDNNLITSQVSGSSSAVENDSARTSVKPKKTILTSPRSNSSSNPFAMRSSIVCSPKLNPGVVLRPSQLGSKVENKADATKNPFSLNPSRLKPFGKVESSKTEPEELPSSSTSTSSNSPKEKNQNENNKLAVVIAEPMESITSTTSSNNGTTAAETPKFVPLAPESRGSTSTVSTTTSTPNFVFGQNLHERVMSDGETDVSSEPVASTSCTSANGTSELLLFSSAVRKTVSSASEQNKEVKTLTESAREYEESRANKRKYEEVAVVTGEEDEKNVLQLNCKLFAFDKATGNWQERGRGTLRLNDKEVSLDDATSFTQSRLVIRVTGSLRVVLNTKIWAEMTLDRASPKSLRLTAMDGSGQIKVFLIMANPDEINQLHRLLEARVHSEVDRQKKQLKTVASEPEVKKRATENSEQ